MTANSYFEYVLTLLGWLVNNGVADADRHRAVRPSLLAKLVALWLKARPWGGRRQRRPPAGRLREHSALQRPAGDLLRGRAVLNVDINTSATTASAQNSAAGRWCSPAIPAMHL